MAFVTTRQSSLARTINIHSTTPGHHIITIITIIAVIIIALLSFMLFKYLMVIGGTTSPQNYEVINPYCQLFHLGIQWHYHTNKHLFFIEIITETEEWSTIDMKHAKCVHYHTANLVGEWPHKIFLYGGDTAAPEDDAFLEFSEEAGPLPHMHMVQKCMVMPKISCNNQLHSNHRHGPNNHQHQHSPSITNTHQHH